MNNCINSRADITQLGTILGIWAHPDDEVFSMGGIMAAAIQNGQTVACITATYGEAGVQDESRWPANQLAQIREKELENAYEILGVHNHHWLDYPDGKCSEIDEAIVVQKLVSLIELYKPDSIMTFGPDGMTGHDDHKTVSTWTTLARNKAGSKATIYHAIHTCAQYDALKELDAELNIYFNVEQPCTCEDTDCAIHLDLDDTLYDQKLRALRSMPSQTEAMLTRFESSLRVSFGVEAFVKF